jgi:regulator of protease activity HflC (stomatin/prohibitin superfamily)
MKEQQNDEIKRLQHEITRVRGEHVSGLSRMKSTFEKQIQQQRTDEDARVQEVRRQANQVCFIFIQRMFSFFFLLKIEGSRTISLRTNNKYSK